MDMTLESLSRGISMFASEHVHETKATGFARMGIAHDVCLGNLAVLLKKLGDVLFIQLWMDAGNKKIRSRVRTLFVSIAIVAGRSAGSQEPILSVSISTVEETYRASPRS